MSKKIVFTGGGTVGHVTLNLIIIPKFLKDGWEVHYIGDKNGIERQEIDKSGLEITFHPIETGKLRRYFSWQNIWDVFKVGYGLLQSLVIIAKLKPQALFSKGGFVAVPPVIAAKLLGTPVFVHESDLTMGLANKISYRFVTKLYTTFSPDSALSKAEHVGAVTKIHDGASQTDNQLIQAIKAQFNPELKTLLFIGGSAGAKVLNDFVSQHPELRKDFNVINITGDANLNDLSPNLYRIDYVTDLYQPLMQLADLVVTRGGSNTLFELLAMQKPHLIIPLGKEASRGDQLENAAYFQEKGYARQILESDLTIARFQQELAHVFAHQEDFVSAMKHSRDIQSPETFYRLLLSDINSVMKER